ncbi:lysine--tRNA ligase [Buchnera aphidicola]|jgi:lysyl-tRNA synthetase class 2|uniref:Lysine--tRNA ligase n=1 Tax=Buchnera aphidicola subsp. Schizaphis graminum (strain Sg) TaxID=198804 RepID=SYK_BUCAP|nr:lysine--tRNA ligase [Buchnera aphidicola]Q8K9C5.1 RecName: Full=Lysine--tRNA ligase; AltName: Full=Lysyl-tRNA synthetase; Short=LysRS [Buchnera aphidicola str. Sg (Schizaphis graminum)]AAM67966.1 lysyl-tRNA synthetase [Buchnera aphidicola str. Sg (Schizaphis graminum)]AWI49540.1 lysine--tRNA ligase [Buchnera aphidicola (Schizaphis graminum)]
MIKKTDLNNNIFQKEKQIRKEKLINMKKNGFSFPNSFKKNTNSIKIHQEYENKTINELKVLNVEVTIAGRMIQRRIMGKASFFTLQDMEGKIQIYTREKEITSDFYNNHFKKWDIGDILGIEGILFKTKTGELSIFSKKLKILTKSLRPLPDKFHGLSNQEKRYRKRYLDLISNNQLFNIFKNRSKIIRFIRNFMIENNFLEVETPMLHNIPGGANARPFITYHNEINEEMYLRIAPELYLKQLIVGGFERIFELNRNFRNEGVSARHNPEFTMMEAYIAYSNYEDMMNFTENLLKNIIKSICGKSEIKYNKYYLNFNIPFKKLTMKESILQFNSNICLSDLKNLQKIKKIANNIGIEIKDNWNIGYIENEIFEKTVEKNLIQPTFITEYPVEVSPLARRNDFNSNVTDRFELFIAGYEIGNGFSELNDSEDQKNRFLNQMKIAEKEKNKDMLYDENYIEALKYGLPPTSGLGIGIDRLIMILTNQISIRDVILFPTLRSFKK